MSSTIDHTFSRITEHYAEPIRIGSSCESNVFYRVEDLTPNEFDEISQVIAERILNVCSPNTIHYVVQLPGCFTEWAGVLADGISEHQYEPVEMIRFSELMSKEEWKQQVKGANLVLANDVITTARSCLEAHTSITVLGASILCWGALIDRTFGPGPVPVAASLTGEPVRLLE